jgi:lipid-binding SYLF domain-containing protein
MKSKVLAILLVTPLFAADSPAKVKERLDNAVLTLNELMGAGDSGIPEDLMKKAECAVVVPGMKQAAFIFGGRFGKGFMTCRNNPDRKWTPPASITLGGGSFGFQAGGSESDIVMLVMNQKGAENLVKNQFTLGGDASVAAGPVGRTAQAQTDASMRAGILSWSRTRGVFGGIALNGAVLKEDRETNQVLYGKTVTNLELTRDTKLQVNMMPEVQKFVNTVADYAEKGYAAAPAKSTK